MTEGITTYESGTAPPHLATKEQLAQKKLLPLADPVAFVKMRKSGRLIALYDWRDTKAVRAVPTVPKRS